MTKQQKYFGEWSNRANVESDFQTSIEPTDRQILLAVYSQGNYEGHAFVLYKIGKKLYEVHAGHCSCYGLEGQWEPEETTLGALRMRNRPPYGCEEAADLWLAIIGRAPVEPEPVDTKCPTCGKEGYTP